MLTAREVVLIVADAPDDWRAGQAVFNYIATVLGTRQGLPEGGNWNSLFYRCVTISQTLAELARHGLLIGEW